MILDSGLLFLGHPVYSTEKIHALKWYAAVTALRLHCALQKRANFGELQLWEEAGTNFDNFRQIESSCYKITQDRSTFVRFICQIVTTKWRDSDVASRSNQITQQETPNNFAKYWPNWAIPVWWHMTTSVMLMTKHQDSKNTVKLQCWKL